VHKLLLTTAAVAAAMAGAVAGETDFGTFTDTRDGQTYKTVNIDGQTWMAENLNYKPPKGKSWRYYHDDTSYCNEHGRSGCNKYGRLYDWNTAKKVCPAGYHLPSRQEWNNLGRAVGGKREQVGGVNYLGAGKKLKAKSGWDVSNGTDNYGFSALPGGWRHQHYNNIPDDTGDCDCGDNRGAGGFGNWWTAASKDGEDAYQLEMNYDNDDMYEYNSSKLAAFSVRCVADRP